MLNDPRSHGLWEMTAPEAPATDSLAAATTADVVVIGAGYTGLSAALHLAQQGLGVTVLEACAPGFGGAGRNVGLVNAGMWVMPEALVDELGPVWGNRLIDFLGNAPQQVWQIIDRHAIACEAEPRGTLHLGVGEQGLSELRERARQWQARGAPVSLLDAAETARRVGSTAYAGALLDLRAGTIQPLAYARGLARAAISAGAQIFTGSPVTAVHAQGDGWRAETPAGSVTARWVIPATDAYTTHIFPELRREQVILPYFNLATEPLSPELQRAILPGREGCWDTREVLTSYRFDRRGRLVFGSVGALRNTGRAVHRAWARRAMKRLWPETGAVRFEAEWFGRIGMTANALPRFHRLAERIVTICGYNGRGIAPGTVCGKALAELVTGERSLADMPMEASVPERPRFPALREALYEYGAQATHLIEARL